MNFEWDSEKAALNLERHRISFEEAATAFGDPLSITIGDPDHSEAEGRYVLLVMTFRGRLVIVVHTDRGENVRLIGARLANRRQRQSYEQDR